MAHGLLADAEHGGDFPHGATLAVEQGHGGGIGIAGGMHEGEKLLVFAAGGHLVFGRIGQNRKDNQWNQMD